MKWASLFGFCAIFGAIFLLFQMGALFSSALWAIALQIAAALLMIWARVTFGLRSFHPGADPTAGGLVISGPYRFIRHPIYAAIFIFVWAGALAHLSPATISLGGLATAGVLVRLVCEERLVRRRYPEYQAYSETTKRLFPGLW